MSLHKRHLRWYGHVSRATLCMNLVMSMHVLSSRGQVRPMKTWSECVMDDMRACSIGGTDPQNRKACRFGVGNAYPDVRDTHSS